MKQALLAAATILLLALAFVAGCTTGRKAAISRLKPEVVEVLHRDTIRVNTPVYVRSYARVHDTLLVAVRDTIVRHDTAFIALPREVKEYRDTNYFARVTGYRPELEYIETYNTEKIVTATIVQEKKLRPRYSLGVSVGYGIPFIIADEVRPAPYMGISINYNLLNWGYK